jgi:hypothetical protein
MAYVAETVKDESGFVLQVIQDEFYDENPYDDDDDVLIAVFSSRYNNPAAKARLTICGEVYDLSDVNDAQAFEAAYRLDPETFPWYVAPLYAYDHSGIVYRVSESGNPFYGHLPQGHAECDSGRAGFIALRREAWGEAKTLLEHAKGVAESFTDYSNGNVYAYIIKDPDGETVDSCGGFLGNYDRVDGALANGRDALKGFVEDYKVEQAKLAAEKLAEDNAALEASRPDLYQGHPLAR